MPVPIPYVAARSSDLPPLESELCVEVPRNGVPHIAYLHPRPDDRDAHGNLWARLTRVEGGAVLFDCMDPLRQRECMEALLCQVCAKPAEQDEGTLFIEWQRPEAPPLVLSRIRTDTPPVCEPCAAISLRHCRFLRGEKTAVVLRARKSVLSGVSGTVYRVENDSWIAADADAYSSYTKPRLPGMIAQRVHRKLRGVAVVDPASLMTAA